MGQPPGLCLGGTAHGQWTESAAPFGSVREPDLFCGRCGLRAPGHGAVHGGAHLAEPPRGAFDARLRAAANGAGRVAVEAEFHLNGDVDVVVHNAASLAGGVGQIRGELNEFFRGPMRGCSAKTRLQPGSLLLKPSSI